MRALRFGVGLVSLTLLALVGTLAVLAALLPAALGLDRVVLVSGSMAPAIEVGDVVLVDPDEAQPGPGTVIVFDDPDRAGGLITHRVIQAHSSGVYRTQGDANATPDTFAVTDEMIHGRGRLLVPLVGYPSAMLQQGHPLPALLPFAGVALLAYLARYGVRRRYDPWLHPAPAATSTGVMRRPALTGTAALTVVLVAGAVLLTMQFSGATYGATTANAANSVTMTQPTKYYLKTSGPGNVVSSPTLPLSTTAPTVAGLPNYDTNRNSAAGLTIDKGGAGLNETDATKIQRWNLVAPSGGLSVTGSASLTVWSALKDFNTSKTGQVAAGLYDCNSSGGACVALGTATLTRAPWSTVVNGWSSKTWSLGTVNTTITAGRILQVRVAPLSGSDDDVMFAYDTTGYPSALSVG